MFVEWLDHASFEIATWREAEEYDGIGPVKVQSIGWVMKEDDDCIVLIQTRSEPKDYDEDCEKYSGDIVILKSAITKQEEVKFNG